MSPTRGALSAADTAERLGVSKSRVSQLRTRALKALREELATALAE